MTSPWTPARGTNAHRGGSASMTRARGPVRACAQPPARPFTRAVSLASLALLMACGQEPDLPPLPPAPLDRAQAEALQRMNTAGATAFAGWTWRYEFGAGCRMRVIKRYEDKQTPSEEHVLTDHYAQIVPYPGSGFGVKAYPRAKAGSADLFDVRTEAQAVAFAKDVDLLIAACAGAAPTAP